MNALAINSSTSAIAIERSTSQVVTGVVVPFRRPEAVETHNPAAVADTMPNEPMIAAVNDNEPENDPEPTGPAVEPEMEIEPEPEAPAVFVPRNAVIERSHLARAIEIAECAIERSSIPILANARLTGRGDMIAVTTTDLDIEVVVSVPAAVDHGFDVTLPAKRMKDLLKGAPKADYVSFEDAEHAVVTDFEKVRYTLQSLPAADFPELAAPSNPASFTMPGGEFVDGLDAVAGAISTEATRYYLNGIFFELRDIGDGYEMRMVATDGHRLYVQRCEMPEITGGWPRAEYMQGVIIPRKTVLLLIKLMRGKKCPAHVNIEVSDAKCRFVFDYEFGTVTVTTKNIDGTFPDYTRVVPSYSNFPAARFDSGALSESIKACTLISSERGKAFKLSVASNGATIAVNNPDEGSARAEVACSWESDPIEIGFNARYALEAIAIAGDDDVSIYLQDAGSPAVVTGDRKGWFAVMMPMRV